MRNYLFFLLYRHVNIKQLIAYSLAALSGTTLIALAFGFYLDINSLLSPQKGLLKHEYIVVNKKVSLLGSLSFGPASFSDREIKSIESESFVNSVYKFTPAQYSVRAYTGSGTFPFSTDMFFESVPDNVLDVDSKDWRWKGEGDILPIIIPRDYLRLYNFGFAGSRGLPQLTEDLIQKISFNIQVEGNNRMKNFKARIVGFSDYLNTILVPESFMNYSNSEYGGGKTKISRLIIEVNDPSSSQVIDYFSKNDYELSNGNTDKSKLAYFLKILIVAILILGALIMFPSIIVLTLSVNLLIYKNQTTLSNLILQGYSRWNLIKPYCILVTTINISIGIVSLIISQLARNIYADKLTLLGVSNTNSFLFSFLFIAFIVLIITTINCIVIRNNVRRIPPIYG